MTIAEDWAKRIVKTITISYNDEEWLMEMLKQVQLDAFKAGVGYVTNHLTETNIAAQNFKHIEAIKL